MNRGKRRSAPVEPTDLTSRSNGDAPKRIRLQAHRKFAEGVPIPGRQCSESFVRPVDVDYFPKNARCSALSGGDVLAANSPENSRDADALDIIAPSAEAFCAYILYDGTDLMTPELEIFNNAALYVEEPSLGATSSVRGESPGGEKRVPVSRRDSSVTCGNSGVSTPRSNSSCATAVVNNAKTAKTLKDVKRSLDKEFSSKPSKKSLASRRSDSAIHKIYGREPRGLIKNVRPGEPPPAGAVRKSGTPISRRFLRHRIVRPSPVKKWLATKKIVAKPITAPKTNESITRETSKPKQKNAASNSGEKSATKSKQKTPSEPRITRFRRDSSSSSSSRSSSTTASSMVSESSSSTPRRALRSGGSVESLPLASKPTPKDSNSVKKASKQSKDNKSKKNSSPVTQKKQEDVVPKKIDVKSSIQKPVTRRVASLVVADEPSRKLRGSSQSVAENPRVSKLKRQARSEPGRKGDAVGAGAGGGGGSNAANLDSRRSCGPKSGDLRSRNTNNKPSEVAKSIASRERSSSESEKSEESTLLKRPSRKSKEACSTYMEVILSRLSAPDDDIDEISLADIGTDYSDFKRESTKEFETVPAKSKPAEESVGPKRGSATRSSSSSASSSSIKSVDKRIPSQKPEEHQQRKSLRRSKSADKGKAYAETDSSDSEASLAVDPDYSVTAGSNVDRRGSVVAKRSAKAGSDGDSTASSDSDEILKPFAVRRSFNEIFEKLRNVPRPFLKKESKSKPDQATLSEARRNLIKSKEAEIFTEHKSKKKPKSPSVAGSESDKVKLESKTPKKASSDVYEFTDSSPVKKESKPSLPKPGRKEVVASKPDIPAQKSNLKSPKGKAVDVKAPEAAEPGEGLELSKAPIYRPTSEEFNDPMQYISKIAPEAQRYGMCCILPPNDFKPDCSMHDDMRFMAYNHYVHKMYRRWNAVSKTAAAILKTLEKSNITVDHMPWIGGVEVDLAALHNAVQSCTELTKVMDPKKWAKVADKLNIPSTVAGRADKLDKLYCKYVLPYAFLTASERATIYAEVEAEYKERLAAKIEEAQKKNDADLYAKDCDDDEDSSGEDESLECVVKSRNMPLSQFYRIARTLIQMRLKNRAPGSSTKGGAGPPPPSSSSSSLSSSGTSSSKTAGVEEIESEYWSVVNGDGGYVCSLAGSIDSGPKGQYGFPPASKPGHCAKHPWNLKVLTNNPASLLRCIGPVMGMTLPTIHVGMLFSTSCWYRDPHGLPWVEYLHYGAQKIWYSVPSHAEGAFRTAMQDVMPMHTLRSHSHCPIWLPSDSAMVPIEELLKRNVPVSRAVQEPGSFVVIFQKCFASSICCGYAVSESVNFAPSDWLTTCMDAFMMMEFSREEAYFSIERFLCNVATDLKVDANVLSQVLSKLEALYSKEEELLTNLKMRGVTFVRSSQNVSKNHEGVDRKNVKRSDSSRPKDASNDEVEEPVCDVCSRRSYFSWVETKSDMNLCLKHGERFLKKHPKTKAADIKVIIRKSKEEIRSCINKAKSRIMELSQRKLSKP